MDFFLIFLYKMIKLLIFLFIYYKARIVKIILHYNYCVISFATAYAMIIVRRRVRCVDCFLNFYLFKLFIFNIKKTN